MIGRTIAHYEILDKLGEGGMGVVYKARDTHLDRFVAIKVLPPEKLADPERKRRFVQEAKAASALNHPNIVVIHDIAQADGEHFIAMEFVAGKTLDSLIPRKGLRLTEALNYAIQIADALAAAHRAGIVHRDIKPTNIMASEEGRVKVLDFGLAKLTEAVEPSPDQATLTLKPESTEGVIVGTVAYMSPEQAEARKIDARSDIFSFGSLLYEMLTGQRAFHGETTIAVLSAILRQEPKPASEVVADLPRDLEKIVTRCLRKDLDRRFQTMADVLVELKEVKEESESGAAIRATPRIARPRWPWLAGAAAALAVAAAAWWFLRAPSVHDPEPSQAEVPLTSYPGDERHPSFSPDGNQVAFGWNGEKQDNYDVYVKLIGPGAPLRLTTNPAPDRSPAWSPDGRWIAFRRELGGGKAGLFLIPALGGPERKLLDAVSPDSWSAASWHPSNNWLAIPMPDPPDVIPSVFAISVTSGQRRRLTAPLSPSTGDADPAFSPDGRSLVFCRRTAIGEGELFILTLSTAMEPQGEVKQLTFDQRITQTPAWTFDGREIIFSIGRPGSYTLWRIRVSQSGSPPGKPERLASVGQDGVSPALSRQGRRLAYTRNWRDLNIWRMQIPGGVSAPFISSTRNEENPKFSPDGQKIAFRSDRSGHNEIWVSDSDASNPVQVTSFGGPMAAEVNWSPDSRRIAFKANTHGHGDIYVIDAEGGAPQRLTTEPSDDLMPAWSQDGRWIYFASNRSGTDQVWKIPATGGAAVQVTRQGGFYSQESPDGRFLYYGKDRNLTTSLWKTPVAGGQETRVLESMTWWMNFQVLNEGIYFMPAGEPPTVQFFRQATAKIEPVATIPKPSAAGLTVSPDGRTLLFTVFEQGGSDLMLVENFGNN